MIGLVVSLLLLYLHVRIEVKAVWQDKLFRFLFWVLAIEIAIWRAASGCLTLDDVLNDLVVGIIVSVPFLR